MLNIEDWKTILTDEQKEEYFFWMYEDHQRYNEMNLDHGLSAHAYPNWGWLLFLSRDQNHEISLEEHRALAEEQGTDEPKCGSCGLPLIPTNEWPAGILCHTPLPTQSFEDGQLQLLTGHTDDRGN